MFITILLTILVAYGITNIIVQGTIFEKVKAIFHQYLTDLSIGSKLDSDDANVDDISITYFFNRWSAKRRMKKIKAIKEELMVEDVNEVVVIAKLQKEVKKFGKFIENEKELKKVVSWFGFKLHKISNCFMCCGFWVGLFLSIVSTLFAINLFGVTLLLITYTTFWSWLVSAFAMSCLISGCVWLINSVSVFFGDGEAPERIVTNRNE